MLPKRRIKHKKSPYTKLSVNYKRVVATLNENYKNIIGKQNRPNSAENPYSRAKNHNM